MHDCRLWRQRWVACNRCCPYGLMGGTCYSYLMPALGVPNTKTQAHQLLAKTACMKATHRLAHYCPRRLGLEGCVDGIDAQKVYGYCMFKGDGEARVAYPTEGEPVGYMCVTYQSIKLQF